MPRGQGCKQNKSFLFAPRTQVRRLVDQDAARLKEIDEILELMKNESHLAWHKICLDPRLLEQDTEQRIVTRHLSTMQFGHYSDIKNNNYPWQKMFVDQVRKCYKDKSIRNLEPRSYTFRRLIQQISSECQVKIQEILIEETLASNEDTDIKRARGWARRLFSNFERHHARAEVSLMDRLSWIMGTRDDQLSSGLIDEVSETFLKIEMNRKSHYLRKAYQFEDYERHLLLSLRLENANSDHIVYHKQKTNAQGQSNYMSLKGVHLREDKLSLKTLCGLQIKNATGEVEWSASKRGAWTSQSHHACQRCKELQIKYPDLVPDKDVAESTSFKVWDDARQDEVKNSVSNKLSVECKKLAEGKSFDAFRCVLDDKYLKSLETKLKTVAFRNSEQRVANLLLSEQEEYLKDKQGSKSPWQRMIHPLQVAEICREFKYTQTLPPVSERTIKKILRHFKYDPYAYQRTKMEKVAMEELRKALKG